MSEHSFDLDAELAREAAMEQSETDQDAIERQQARHEARVHGQLWGSDAGLSNLSDSASEAGTSTRGGHPPRKSLGAPTGESEFYFSGPPRHAGNPHWRGGMGRAGSHSGVEDSEAGHQYDGPREEDGNQSSVFRIAPQTCHVRYMPGFNELNGLALLGHGINMQPMIFDHSATNSTGWVRYDHAGVVNSAPVRAMVFNIPAECWSNDAAKFKDWQTPMNNALRVASIAALLGIVMTPLSKGFMCAPVPPSYPPNATRSNSARTAGLAITRRKHAPTHKTRATMAAAKRRANPGTCAGTRCSPRMTMQPTSPC